MDNIVSAWPPAEPIVGEVQSADLTLRYLDWGPRDARPIVLVHGIRDQARNWEATALRLADRHRVVALDLRGHGDSDRSPGGAYFLPYNVEDVGRLVEALGWDRVTMVGHSYGGSVLSRYAAISPDRVEKLVLVDGFGPSPKVYAMWAEEGTVPRLREWVAQRRAQAERPARLLASIEEGMARLAKGNPALDQAQLEHMARHALRPEGQGFAWKFDPRVSMFAPEDFAFPIEQYWKHIAVPTLLCHGAQSWSALQPDDPRLGTLRDYRLHAIPDAGHWPHHDQLDLFVAMLRDFID